ncbi:hypothetical protein CRYUN_Cryun12cG0140200 [Craigia yunnanensis]
MFHSAYLAVQKYFRHGPWYHEADMRTGKATYWQFTSLQAFSRGLQVLVGDIRTANSSHRICWTTRYYILLKSIILCGQSWQSPHSTYIKQPKTDPRYIQVGESIVNSLNSYTKVKGGFARVRDVTTMQLEDQQHSFFLAET